jgi:hypothetical protein
MIYRGSIYFDIKANSREEALQQLYLISMHLHAPQVNDIDLNGVSHYVGNVATLSDIYNNKESI